MEFPVGPVVGGAPEGVCGDPGLHAVDGELVHGRLEEISCRSMFNMSKG